MNFDRPLTRRASIKKLLTLSGGMTLGMGVLDSFQADGASAAGSGRYLVDAFGQRQDFTVKTLVQKTFEAVGGIETVIAKGDVVAIKPNVSWARPPHLAATTNPAVLEAVVELCYQAGAAKVRIADHTIHGARRCFSITGVGAVAQKTGADLVRPRSSLMRDMKLRGKRLDVWPVFKPIVEADKLINLPVAKVHGLSQLTLGMKNWIGAVGGRRNALHQDIHQTIVDLAHFFKPTVTLIDATRVMIRNGPSGGNPADVAVMNRLILSNDPVAADARAARLFSMHPDHVGFVRLAKDQGLGVYDTEVDHPHQVTV